MRDDERLVLLAWPRSGSSSLWEILRTHPDLRLMADEPFNESYVEWAPGNPDYLGRIHDVDSLDVVLEELFTAYDGIKVLTYQLDEEQLTHLVMRPDIRIVAISRRNLLQTAVSDRIAKQTRVWNRWDVPVEERLEDRYRSLAPLDLKDLRGYIRELAAHLSWVDALLTRRGGGHVLRLVYEDLYFGTHDEQVAQMDALWRFLDLPPADSPEADFYLDPRTAKLGTHDTYGRLPNVAQIDSELGADDTGWLFPLTP